MRMRCKLSGCEIKECAAEQYMKSMNITYELLPYIHGRIYNISLNYAKCGSGADVEKAVSWRLWNICAACAKPCEKYKEKVKPKAQCFENTVRHLENCTRVRVREKAFEKER